ncbi:MAG: acetylxylan esterase [Acidobacteria bacterium]|nr:acetylxylan esterase [Acidobacteriota bacterium]
MKSLWLLLTLLSLLTVNALAQSSAFVPNYDEAKIGTYTLPDPLTMQDGTKVTTAPQWRKRRAELLQLFATHVYGHTPATKPVVRFEEKLRDAKSFGGLATRREITVHFTPKSDGPKMHLMLYVPNKKTGRVPAFIAMNYNGNHAVHSDPTITMSTAWMRENKDNGIVNNRATEKSRGVEARRWPIEMIVQRGYAVATFYYGDLFPDHKDGLPDSIIPHFTKAEDWNAIGAWAWGFSRVLDYLERDKNIDAKRVAIVGHSRHGKAALWAGAQDERFAMVVSNDSGESGAALARRNFGETVARINTSFPHWFNAKYKTYNDRVSELPIDQHELLALIAPRPLYVASAVEDQWADPHGEFLAAQAASPVYQMLGTDGLKAVEMPGIHQPVMSTIGYHIRAGGHDLTQYDWEQFLNFADRHFRRK